MAYGALPRPACRYHDRRQCQHIARYTPSPPTPRAPRPASDDTTTQACFMYAIRSSHPHSQLHDDGDTEELEEMETKSAIMLCRSNEGLQDINSVSLEQLAGWARLI